MYVQWVGMPSHTLGRYTGKRVAKPLPVFWGQECLPFGLNGVQVQGTFGLRTPPSLTHFPI